MINNNQTAHLRREILVRIIKAFRADDFFDRIDRIPFEMRPKGKNVDYRCCIYKEREILRKRIIAGMGYSLEDDNEIRRLSDYAAQALKRLHLDKSVLTVNETACQGCVPSRIFVTDLCQGCVARPCVSNCNFDAISVQNGKSVVDCDKCKNCTKCIQVCPYKAIVKRAVPCEDACQVKAIHKGENGDAQIDFDKCISCGACVAACPFGAVHEKSQIIDVMRAFTSDKKVVAMIAPSVVGQLPGTLPQLANGLIQAGFDEVVEVAQWADITAIEEVKDFRERLHKGDRFMTTSCCAAYNELAKKHLPEIKAFKSSTPTPMCFTAARVKKTDPDCISVFIGPCVAKRKESLLDKNVDYVLSYEEMGALFVALKIELTQCDEYQFAGEASAQGRAFGVSGGVAQAVLAADKITAEHRIPDNEIIIKAVTVNGLSPQSIAQLKFWAKKGECTNGNLIEVMVCEGGCAGGACVINDCKSATKALQPLLSQSKPLSALLKNHI